MPDELKKHYLSDGEGGQYSTNLDRNRYGNDDNYLFTVIRYDLEFLGLCPCMVDVEIIDAKQVGCAGWRCTFHASAAWATCASATNLRDADGRPPCSASRATRLSSCQRVPRCARARCEGRCSQACEAAEARAASCRSFVMHRNEASCLPCRAGRPWTSSHWAVHYQAWRSHRLLRTRTSPWRMHGLQPAATGG